MSLYVYGGRTRKNSDRLVVAVSDLCDISKIFGSKYENDIKYWSVTSNSYEKGVALSNPYNVFKVISNDGILNFTETQFKLRDTKQASISSPSYRLIVVNTNDTKRNYMRISSDKLLIKVRQQDDKLIRYNVVKYAMRIAALIDSTERTLDGQFSDDWFIRLDSNNKSIKRRFRLVDDNYVEL